MNDYCTICKAYTPHTTGGCTLDHSERNKRFIDEALTLAQVRKARDDAYADVNRLREENAQLRKELELWRATA